MMQYRILTVFVWSLLLTDVVSLCPDVIGHMIQPDYYFRLVQRKYVLEKCPSGKIFDRETCQCEHKQKTTTGTSTSLNMFNSRRSGPLQTFSNIGSQPWLQRTPANTMQFGGFNTMQQQNTQFRPTFFNFLSRLQNAKGFNFNIQPTQGQTNFQTSNSFQTPFRTSGSSVSAKQTKDNTGNNSDKVVAASEVVNDINRPSSFPMPVDPPSSYPLPGETSLSVLPMSGDGGSAQSTILNFKDMSPSASYKIKFIKSADTVVPIAPEVAASTTPSPETTTTTTAPFQPGKSLVSSNGQTSANQFQATNANTFNFNSNSNPGWNAAVWNTKTSGNQRQGTMFQGLSQSGFQRPVNTAQPSIMGQGMWPNFNQFQSLNQGQSMFNGMHHMGNQHGSMNNLYQGKHTPLYPVAPMRRNPLQMTTMFKFNVPTTPIPNSFMSGFQNAFSGNSQMNSGFPGMSMNNMPLNSPLPAMDLAIQNTLAAKTANVNFGGMGSGAAAWIPNPQLHWSQNIRMADVMEVTDAQRDAYVQQELLTNSNLTPAERLSLREIMA